MRTAARRTLRLLIVTLVLAVAAGVGLQAADTVVLRSTGPSGYRGAVAANFYGGDIGDEIIVDFGSLGLWYRGSYGPWVQLTSQNPEWIFAAEQTGTFQYTLIADFGSAGLWQWTYDSPGLWRQLSTANAEGGIAADDDNDGVDELQVDFGSLGLWRFDLSNRTWVQYTASNPETVGQRSHLDGLIWGTWDFGASGLWVCRWNGAPYWYQLSASDPTPDSMAADLDADGWDELVVEFSGLGTWVWHWVSSGGTWTRVTATDSLAVLPVRFGGDDWEAIFVDGNGHPWFLDNMSTWNRLSYAPMDYGFAVAYKGSAALAADFGSLGLWEYDHAGGSWTQLTSTNPVFMVPYQHYMYGSSQASLLVNFGQWVGLWNWNSSMKTWSKLTDAVPDASMEW